jgi:hypothetical protein
MTNTIDTIVHRYIDAWNEPDAERRLELVAGVWTEDGSYVDPLLSGVGHDAIAGMIGDAQERFPGHRFELSFGPDVHHNYARFAWRLYGPAGGEPVASGVDFATLEEGRMLSVTGFLEAPTA